MSCLLTCMCVLLSLPSCTLNSMAAEAMDLFIIISRVKKNIMTITMLIHFLEKKYTQITVQLYTIPCKKIDHI